MQARLQWVFSTPPPSKKKGENSPGHTLVITLASHSSAFTTANTNETKLGARGFLETWC